MHQEWEVFLLCYGRCTLQVRFIQSEGWLDPGERAGAFLGVIGEALGEWHVLASSSILLTC